MFIEYITVVSVHIAMYNYIYMSYQMYRVPTCSTTQVTCVFSSLAQGQVASLTLLTLPLCIIFIFGLMPARYNTNLKSCCYFYRNWIKSISR